MASRTFTDTEACALEGVGTQVCTILLIADQCQRNEKLEEMVRTYFLRDIQHLLEIAALSLCGTRTRRRV